MGQRWQLFATQVGSWRTGRVQLQRRDQDHIEFARRVAPVKAVHCAVPLAQQWTDRGVVAFGADGVGQG